MDEKKVVPKITASKYSCKSCLLIIQASCLDTGGNCPICGDAVDPICEKDHPCRCAADVYGGILYCELCNQPICACGCHDVVVLSRITGYISDTSGWRKHKLAELKDRHRYDIAVN